MHLRLRTAAANPRTRQLSGYNEAATSYHEWFTHIAGVFYSRIPATLQNSLALRLYHPLLRTWPCTSQEGTDGRRISINVTS